jgi:low temperature requirement protein LtrA
VLVHAGLYSAANPNIWRIVPINLSSALLVLGAGLIPGAWRYAAWVAALALQALSPLLVRVGGRFDIQPAHFAERHSGLLIVAFGESVVAIGIGEAGHKVTFGLAAAAISGLALTAALWWAFFGAGDDERAELTMTAASAHARPGLALNGYFFAYIPMLLGIVVIAAGVKRSIGQPADTAPAASLALAGGAALFLAGDIVFRRVLSAGPALIRAVAAAAALVTAVIGALLAVEAQLLALVAVLGLMLAAEHRPVRHDPAPGGDPGGSHPLG